MKSLKIDYRNKNEINDLVIADFEAKMNIKIPLILQEFLKLYSGSSIEENTFVKSEKETIFTLSYVCELYSEFNPSIEKLVNGNQFYKYYDWVPFGIDPGGWVFNLSIANDKFGQVWINKFDSGDDNPFEFVADTFEEFINGLRTEEETFG